MKLTSCVNIEEVGVGDSYQSINGAHFFDVYEYTEMQPVHRKMYEPLYLLRFGVRNEVKRDKPWPEVQFEQNYYTEAKFEHCKLITIKDCSKEQANEIRELLSQENSASFSFFDTLKKLTKKGSGDESANTLFTKEDLDSFVTSLDDSKTKIVLMAKLLKSIPGK